MESIRRAQYKEGLCAKTAQQARMAVSKRTRHELRTRDRVLKRKTFQIPIAEPGFDDTEDVDLDLDSDGTLAVGADVGGEAEAEAEVEVETETETDTDPDPDPEPEVVPIPIEYTLEQLRKDLEFLKTWPGYPEPTWLQTASEVFHRWFVWCSCGSLVPFEVCEAVAELVPSLPALTSQPHVLLPALRAVAKVLQFYIKSADAAAVLVKLIVECKDVRCVDVAGRALAGLCWRSEPSIRNAVWAADADTVLINYVYESPEVCPGIAFALCRLLDEQLEKPGRDARVHLQRLQVVAPLLIEMARGGVWSRPEVHLRVLRHLAALAGPGATLEDLDYLFRIGYVHLCVEEAVKDTTPLPAVGEFILGLGTYVYHEDPKAAAWVVEAGLVDVLNHVSALLGSVKTEDDHIVTQVNQVAAEVCWVISNLMACGREAYELLVQTGKPVLNFVFGFADVNRDAVFAAANAILASKDARNHMGVLAVLMEEGVIQALSSALQWVSDDPVLRPVLWALNELFEEHPPAVLDFEDLGGTRALRIACQTAGADPYIRYILDKYLTLPA